MQVHARDPSCGEEKEGISFTLPGGDEPGRMLPASGRPGHGPGSGPSASLTETEQAGKSCPCAGLCRHLPSSFHPAEGRGKSPAGSSEAPGGKEQGRTCGKTDCPVLPPGPWGTCVPLLRHRKGMSSPAGSWTRSLPVPAQ